MTSGQHLVPAELAAAVLERRQVRFCYAKDQPAGEPRTVSPHAVYRTLAGKVCLQGVQVAGPSSHGPAALPGWRTFELDLMSRIEALPERFPVAPEFRPASPVYRHMIIDCLRGWSKG